MVLQAVLDWRVHKHIDGRYVEFTTLQREKQGLRFFKDVNGKVEKNSSSWLK